MKLRKLIKLLEKHASISEDFEYSEISDIMDRGDKGVFIYYTPPKYDKNAEIKEVVVGHLYD